MERERSSRRHVVDDLQHRAAFVGVTCAARRVVENLDPGREVAACDVVLGTTPAVVAVGERAQRDAGPVDVIKRACTARVQRGISLARRRSGVRQRHGGASEGQAGERRCIRNSCDRQPRGHHLAEAREIRCPQGFEIGAKQIHAAGRDRVDEDLVSRHGGESLLLEGRTGAAHGGRYRLVVQTGELISDLRRFRRLGCRTRRICERAEGERRGKGCGAADPHRDGFACGPGWVKPRRVNSSVRDLKSRAQIACMPTT